MDLWTYEREQWNDGIQTVCGVDEAGAGPLAGPVYAAAVILPRELEIPGLNDSKKLTEKKREALFDIIVEKALFYSIARVEAAEIDEIDLAAVRVGDVLSYTLDAYPGETFSGAVTEIRPIGAARQNATYFDVRITLPDSTALLPGMNATVTLDK